jgi:hypothetical protein
MWGDNGLYGRLVFNLAKRAGNRELTIYLDIDMLISWKHSRILKTWGWTPVTRVEVSLQCLSDTIELIVRCDRKSYNLGVALEVWGWG